MPLNRMTWLPGDFLVTMVTFSLCSERRGGLQIECRKQGSQSSQKSQNNPSILIPFRVGPIIIQGPLVLIQNRERLRTLFFVLKRKFVCLRVCLSRVIRRNGGRKCSYEHYFTSQRAMSANKVEKKDHTFFNR